MCGIVGVAGNITVKEEKALRTMLILDQIRGEDSTGIAAVDTDGEVWVAKEVGPPHILFDSRMYTKTLARKNRVVIGHNRYATVGGVSRRTAHPFEVDHLVGVHNGTIRNKYKLLDHTQFTVDSENLYHHIARNGLRDLLNTVDGAYSLVWWDTEEEELNFLRNDERPMFIAASADKKTIFWASEMWMIQVACQRENIPLEAPFSTVIDMHYRFKIKRNCEIGKPVIKHEKCTFQPHVYTGTQQHGWTRTFPSQEVKTTTPTAEVVKFPTTVSAGLIEAYLKKKGVILEITGKGRDKNGANYLTLMDESEPTVPVRLYVKKNDPLLDEIGELIKGDITSFNKHPTDGAHFKVSPMTVKRYVEIPNDDLEADEQALLSQNIFSDWKGNKLSVEEWKEKYPRCEWCTDNLNPEDQGNRLLEGQDGCLCPSCATSPDVTQYVNLKPVF